MILLADGTQVRVVAKRPPRKCGAQTTAEPTFCSLPPSYGPGALMRLRLLYARIGYGMHLRMLKDEGHTWVDSNGTPGSTHNPVIQFSGLHTT